MSTLFIILNLTNVWPLSHPTRNSEHVGKYPLLHPVSDCHEADDIASASCITFFWQPNCYGNIEVTER